MVVALRDIHAGDLSLRIREQYCSHRDGENVVVWMYVQAYMYSRCQTAGKQHEMHGFPTITVASLPTLAIS